MMLRAVAEEESLLQMQAVNGSRMMLGRGKLVEDLKTLADLQ